MIKIIKCKQWRARKNTIVLHYDNWDDYGYKTTYRINYYDKDGNSVWESSIQIYCTRLDEDGSGGGKVDEYLPSEIAKLDDSFCSLGCDMNFYSGLKKALPKDYLDILNRLNDLAYNEKRWNQFKKYTGVQKSLLRSSSSIKAREEAFAILENNFIKEKNLSFSYRTRIPYSDIIVSLNFLFNKKADLPHRINAIVGKNGTGKTHILNNLAEDLSGFKLEEFDDNAFERGKRPSFDKVISVSYSAFDPFKKLKGQNSLNSYVYCGIQSEKGTLKLNEIQDNFWKSLETIKKRDRYEQWKRIITELFAEENYNITSQIDESRMRDINWSSGQNVLISSMTEVVAKIDKESIILFDEPELHLHPNAIANVMRMFNKILEEFNSYAIIATHSPIILQEIPSNNIIVLERIDNQPFVRRPEIECFGENISLITRDIFDVTSKESYYQAFFFKMKETGKTKEQIEKLFEYNLGLNALIYLETLYKQEK